MWRKIYLILLLFPSALQAQHGDSTLLDNGPVEIMDVDSLGSLPDSAALPPLFKNIILSSSSGEEFFPCEPSVAINRKNPENIIVAASLNKMYVTQDTGTTWTERRMTSEYGVWGDPVVISDKKGNLYYFHLSDPTGKNWLSEEILDRIVVQKSDDGGITWYEGIYTGHNPPKDQDKEWATIDKKGKIYLTWTQFDKLGSKKPDHKSNIMFSYSSNGGKKWREPLIINQLAGNCIGNELTVQGSMPAVTEDGKLFVVWAYDGQIFLDRSYDKGKTWLRNDIVVTQQPGGWNLTVPGIQRCNGMPVLIADNSDTQNNGMLYLNWSDQRNGENDTDIWFTSSHNGGDTWSTRVRVNDDSPGRHQFMSGMAQDQSTGIIYILYYDRRAYEDNKTDVYLAYSKNGGRSFKNVKISEAPFTPDEDHFFGDYISIDALEGTIVPVWTHMDDGKTSVMTSIIRQEELDKLGLNP